MCVKTKQVLIRRKYDAFPMCLIHRLTVPMTWVNDRWSDDHDHMGTVVIRCSHVIMIVRPAIIHPCHWGS